MTKTAGPSNAFVRFAIHAHRKTIAKRGTTVPKGVTGAFKTVTTADILMQIIAAKASNAGEDRTEEFIEDPCPFTAGVADRIKT
jgi:hypothetical protein